jgi:hypothetical protein
MLRQLWRFLYPKPTGFCRGCGCLTIEDEHYCPICWAETVA